MMVGSIQLVTSGLLTADAITCFPTPGHRPGAGCNIASKRAMGRFEATADSDVTRLRVVRRLSHGESAGVDLMEDFHPAKTGKTCGLAPSSKGDAASKGFHPEKVPAGELIVDRISTCAPDDLTISLCAKGEPNSICAGTPVEHAVMSAACSQRKTRPYVVMAASTAHRGSRALCMNSGGCRGENAAGTPTWIL